MHRRASNRQAQNPEEQPNIAPGITVTAAHHKRSARSSIAASNSYSCNWPPIPLFPDVFIRSTKEDARDVLHTFALSFLIAAFALWAIGIETRGKALEEITQPKLV